MNEWEQPETNNFKIPNDIGEYWSGKTFTIQGSIENHFENESKPLWEYVKVRKEVRII